MKYTLYLNRIYRRKYVKVLALRRVVKWQKLVMATVIVLSSLAYGQKQSKGIQTGQGFDDLPAKIKLLRPAIVAIYVNGQRNGSGFVISKSGHILTATHVIGAPYITAQNTIGINYLPNIEVVFNDGTKLPAQPVNLPESTVGLYDSAMLKVDRATPDFLTLSKRPREDGSKIYLMGFPLDLPNAVTYTGTIASQYQLPAGSRNGRTISKNMIQVQAPIAKGFSGSALVDYENNEVIGIVEIKIGGINDALQKVAQTIQTSQRTGSSVQILGVDSNGSLLQVIGVLDAYLSAGSGSAVSIEHIFDAAKGELARNKQ